MTRRFTRGLTAGLLMLGLTGATAVAHHGWSDYDQAKPLTYEGTITASAYTNPHGTMKFDVNGKVWDVVLAPVARMQARGLTEAMLAPGTRAVVVGYQHRETPTEMRAENVTIAGKKVELR